MLRTKRTQALKNYLVTLLDETEYDLKNHGDQGGCHSSSADNTLRVSLRSRRLERKKERAREKKTHAIIILQIIRTPNTIIVAVVLNLAKTYL